MKLSELRQSRIHSMTLAALLIAVGVIFSGVLSFYLPLFGYPSLKVDLTSVILLLGGILLGPIYGGLIGLGTDLLGFVIFAPGTYHPGITLNQILFGVIGGLISHLIWKPTNKSWFSYVNIGLGMLLLGGGIAYVAMTDTVFAGGQVVELTPVIKTTLLIAMVAIVGGMTAVIVWIAYKYRTITSLVQIALFIVIVTEVILNILIMPIWIEQLMGIPYAVNAFVRVFRAIFLIPFKFVLLLAVLRLTRIKIV